MAIQESYTRTDGVKFVLRQANDGRWSVKCLTPPEPGADTKQWDVAWEITSWSVDGADVPFTEQEARNIYGEYMG